MNCHHSRFCGRRGDKRHTIVKGAEAWRRLATLHRAFANVVVVVVVVKRRMKMSWKSSGENNL
jgi:hypothetical protein